MAFIAVNKENLLSDLASERVNLVYFGYSFTSLVFWFKSCHSVILKVPGEEYKLNIAIVNFKAPRERYQ